MTLVWYDKEMAIQYLDTVIVHEDTREIHFLGGVRVTAQYILQYVLRDWETKKALHFVSIY